MPVIRYRINAHLRDFTMQTPASCRGMGLIAACELSEPHGGMTSMGRFEPKNPDYAQAAMAIFRAQLAMRTLGISVARLEPGEVHLSMPYSGLWTQQNGF